MNEFQRNVCSVLLTLVSVKDSPCGPRSGTVIRLFVEERAEKEETAKNVAAAIIVFMNTTENEKEHIRTTLQEKVTREYSLTELVPRILGLLESSRGADSA